MRLDDPTADGQSHASALLFCREKRIEDLVLYKNEPSH